MSRLVILGLVLAATACVTDESGDGNPNPGPGPGSGSGSGPGPSGGVLPRSGQWYYDDITKISSTCAGDETGVHGSFLIENVSASGFRVIPGDGTDPFSCTLTDGMFFCPDRAQLVEDLRPGIDAVLSARATADGSFSTTLRGSGRQEATVTCTGSGCAQLGSFPCNLQVSFSILAR